jgi:hypothetical protein
MFILDTDSITHDQNAHPVLIERVKTTPRQHLFTTSVTVEEQLKGRRCDRIRAVQPPVR